MRRGLGRGASFGVSGFLGFHSSPASASGARVHAILCHGVPLSMNGKGKYMQRSKSSNYKRAAAIALLPSGHLQLNLRAAVVASSAVHTFVCSASCVCGTFRGKDLGRALFAVDKHTTRRPGDTQKTTSLCWRPNRDGVEGEWSSFDVHRE